MGKEFDRQALYDAVWAKPMVEVAAERGFSDRGLAKFCMRNNIPVPPRGWWAKKQAGHDVATVPLPDSDAALAPDTPRAYISAYKPLGKACCILRYEAGVLPYPMAKYIGATPDALHRFEAEGAGLDAHHIHRLLTKLQCKTSAQAVEKARQVPPVHPAQLGAAIRTLRQNAGYSYPTLARYGKTDSMVLRHLESGRSHIDGDKLQLILASLSCRNAAQAIDKAREQRMAAVSGTLDVQEGQDGAFVERHAPRKEQWKAATAYLDAASAGRNPAEVESAREKLRLLFSRRDHYSTDELEAVMQRWGNATGAKPGLAFAVLEHLAATELPPVRSR